LIIVTGQAQNEAERRTTSNGATTSQNDPVCVLELSTPRRDVFQDGGPVIREGKRTLPLGTGSKHEEVIIDTFTGGKNNSPSSVFAEFDGSDTGDFDDAVVFDEKAVVRNEDLVLELALGGGRHADAGRKVNRERARSHKGERSSGGIELGGEDASNGSACGTTTDDDDAFPGTVGHFVGGKEREEVEKSEVENKEHVERIPFLYTV